MKKVYLDNASSTVIDPSIKILLDNALAEGWANPNSLHRAGQDAALFLSDSRDLVASVLNCSSDEIIFTSCATESNNLVIKSFNINEVLSTKIEHDSIFLLTKNHIKVDADGFVDISDLESKLNSSIKLISIILVNNEIGVIQPLDKIVSVVKSFNPNILIHIDASQAPQHVSLDVEKLGVDLMTLSGQKIYAGKGAGCLYSKKSVKLNPLILGGGQESNNRSGTQNVPAIHAFANALKLCKQTLEKENKRQVVLRDLIINSLLSETVIINGYWSEGDYQNRVANNINLTIKGVDTQVLTTFIDLKGFCISGGSACHSGAIATTNRIIEQLHNHSGANIRVTIGRFTTKEEIESFIIAFKEAIKLFA